LIERIAFVALNARLSCAASREYCSCKGATASAPAQPIDSRQTSPIEPLHFSFQLIHRQLLHRTGTYARRGEQCRSGTKHRHDTEHYKTAHFHGDLPSWISSLFISNLLRLVTIHNGTGLRSEVSCGVVRRVHPGYGLQNQYFELQLT
jgi:hypothetical protein